MPSSRASRRASRVDVACHLGRLAEQHLHRHVDGAVVEVAIVDDQVAVVGQRPDHRNRAALALAERVEFVIVRRR